ncbi:IS982 family transposase [bacterium]|nr:IS982 family transposase [bacterium]
MNNFIANYDKILEVLKDLGIPEQFICQIRKPKLNDRELIAINLTAEYQGLDSEHQLFRVIDGTILSSRITRTVYNRRRKRLSLALETVRKALSNHFNEFEDYFVVDSMPLEVCKLSRSTRSKICREHFNSAPDKGFCASQQMFFFGYKLHAICSARGVFQMFDISKASVHDIHYLKDISQQLKDCVLLGDKGYLGAECQLDLFERAQIKLETPSRFNQKTKNRYPYVFRKTRKIIETLFSQLCDQFMIRRNYAKSFDGFKTRILSKITSLSVLQFINHIENRPINNLKINIS